MAKLIPAIDDCYSSTNSSERKVAEALIYHLKDDCLIWANPRIPPNNLEADFIVLDPAKGLIVVEVKGWHLNTIGQASSNSVTLITPNGNSQANNPYKQATNCMYAVVDKLRKQRNLVYPQGHSKQGKLVFPHIAEVIFTNISRDDLRQKELEEVFGSRSVLCCDEIVNSIDSETFVQRLWSPLPFSLPTRLTPEQIDSICHSLCLEKPSILNKPTIPIHKPTKPDVLTPANNKSLGDRLNGNEILVSRISKDQDYHQDRSTKSIQKDIKPDVPNPPQDNLLSVRPYQTKSIIPVPPNPQPPTIPTPPTSIKKELPILAGLVRLTLISSVTLGIATVSNFFTHHKYWNFTIFAVQTVDFNILSHSLPTKLSIILEQGKQAEIQRTLDSNYGLFGLVVTDCKTVEVKCANQKVLYSSKSKFRWQQKIGASKLLIHPYDNLRNPPPILAEGYFASTSDRQRQPTNQTNSGVIIGRVYYVRNQPPTFIQDYTRWIKKPLGFSGVNAIYFLTVSLFMLGGFFTWMIGEKILHQKRVQHKLAQQEREQLIEKQQQLVNQAQSLQKQLQEKLKQINLLLEQRQQDYSKLEDDRALQAQQIQQLERAIALSAIQEVHQRETLQTSQQELLAFQQHEQVVNAQSQQREQIVTDLQQQIDRQKLEQQQESNILEELRRELENTKVKESATQHQAEVLQQTIEVLTYEQEQTTRNSEQLGLSLSQTANIEDLTATLELAKTELNQSKQFGELALEDNEQLRNKVTQLSVQYEEAQLENLDLQDRVQDRQKQTQYYYDYCTKAALGHQTTAVLEPQLNWEIVENTDLSALHLALVGGDPKVRRQVIDELRQNYKLQEYVEIPPSSEVYISRQTVKAKVSRCNLIAVITKVVGHDIAVILRDLKQDGAIDGELLWLDYEGKSGIVRSILQYVKSDAFRAIATK